MSKFFSKIAFLVVLAVAASMPYGAFAADDAVIKELMDRINKLEKRIADQEAVAPKGVAAAPSADEKKVDFGGFIRTRYHISNTLTYGAGQIMPPDKNAAVASDDTRNFFEQRARLYISPKLGDYVTGNFAFEINYYWGNSAYDTAFLAGGGLMSDSVNLWTKNLNIVANIPNTNLTATVGIQNLKDAYNGILLGWADAPGINLNYKVSDNLNATLGFFRFWQPTSGANPSADFVRAEVAYAPSKELNLGFNLYALWDRTGAKSGTSGVLGTAGCTTKGGFACMDYNVSTGYESLTGTNKYTMNLYWPGVNFTYKAGNFDIDGFLIYEGGQYKSGTAGISDVDISSVAANLGIGTTLGPVNLKLSGLYVTGDDSTDNPSIGIKENGFYTPGAYSLAAAWMGLTGMKILFPDIDGTTQDQYLIYDVTNVFEQRPLGVAAIMLTGNTKLTPKTTLEAGVGVLWSAEDRVVNGDNHMATEINAGIHHEVAKGLSVGVVGAVAFTGNFYEVSAAQAAAYNATKSSPGAVSANTDPADIWRVYFRTNYAF
ncbi:MAG: hypothetical protein U0411_03245 [Thermodesulfovibrionales bacterium]